MEPLVVLRLGLRSVDLSLPPQRGMLWRSAMGAALHAGHPGAFEALFGDPEGEARPFALRPPLRPVRPGQRFELSLVLWGDGCAWSQDLVEAALRMGRSGVGSLGGRFALEDIRRETFAPSWWRQRHPGWPAASAGPAPCAPGAGESDGRAPGGDPMTVRVRALTPVALKHDNAWLEQAPTLELWVRRILGRIRKLSPTSDGASVVEADEVRHWLDMARRASLAQMRATRVWLKRQSARTGRTMSFPAWIGQWVYEGVSPELGTVLRWTTLLPIGAKTAFGCGWIEVRGESRGE